MTKNFILCLSLYLLSAGISAQEIQNPYNQSPEEQEALKSWDPDLLGDKIIYHDIIGYSWKKWNSLKAPEGIFGYKLLKNPSLIAQNPKISATLISAKHRKVFVGVIGLILKAPPENIVGMFPFDASTPSLYEYSDKSRAILQGWANLDQPPRKSTIRTPDQLMAQTGKGNYNEIMITGIVPEAQSEVEVEGIALKCDADRSLTELNDLEFEKAVRACLKTVRLNFNIHAIRHFHLLLKDLKEQGMPIRGMILNQ